MCMTLLAALYPPSDMVSGVFPRWCSAGVRGCRLPHLSVEGKPDPPNLSVHSPCVLMCCHGNLMLLW